MLLSFALLFFVFLSLALFLYKTRPVLCASLPLAGCILNIGLLMQTAEVRKGECVLRDGKRQIYVVKVIITDGDCELVEARQISVSNGHVKERQRCLSEKLHPSDGSIRKAAYRGICEELGDIVGTSPQVRFVEASVCTAEEIGKSSSFPGLMTQYTLYSVQAEIEGLTREATSDSFITVEDGRVHQWEWKKSSPSDVKGKSTSAASHN